MMWLFSRSREITAKKLREMATRLRVLLLSGPYFVAGPGGFIIDEEVQSIRKMQMPTHNPPRYTKNIREARVFSTWIEADNFARLYNMKWWAIVKTAYYDREAENGTP